MHDARSWRYHTEILEGLLAPAQEFVALTVALKLDLRVALESGGAREEIHLHRVVDDQVDRNQGIDLCGVAAQPLYRRAHGGQIHYGRNSGEILKDYPRRLERHLVRRRHLGVPLGERSNVFLCYQSAVAISQQSFQQNFDREGEMGNCAVAGLLKLLQTVNYRR